MRGLPAPFVTVTLVNQASGSSKALGDPVVRHDLGVILVGADAQVGGAGESLLGGNSIRYINICSCVMELHEPRPFLELR